LITTAYENAKATYTMFLAAVRATEKELVRIKEIAAQAKQGQIVQLRKQYSEVRQGGLVRAQIAKAERTRVNACYAMRWTSDISAMERALALQPTRQRIARLTAILAAWPTFDVTGRAMIDTTSSVMKAHSQAAAACEAQRDYEHVATAITTCELIRDHNGNVIGSTTKQLPQITDQPDWQQIVKADDVMREVNRVLYAPPVSIGDTRLMQRIRTKAQPRPARPPVQRRRHIVL
jgi:hypothetical protein